MNSLFLSSVRSSLMTLGLLAGLTAPSLAGPVLQPDLSVPANAAAPEIIPVRDEWAGSGPNGQNEEDWRWRRHDGRRWSNNFGERRFTRSNDWDNGNWNGGDNWRWRHHRHHRGGDFDGGAAILGLGLGLGLGSIYNNGYYNNGYYNGGYYVQPAPRRYYRAQRLSSAHVQWCYDRYRSYRVRDNTFQPYNGPRQQCWSPYS